MTRYAMAVDLNRCVGCQTCTAACKHANATAPGVQWRRVLDIEAGEFPDVRRAFVPVGCMHCEDPPCVDVCPSTATRRRADGLVTIDYDLCIGCAYCAVACPYQARFKVERPRYAYGGRRMAHEAVREDPRRLGVAQKCTFCIERIDSGTGRGLVPGVAPEATPACVASCIAEALHFGDLDDPSSNVSGLIGAHRTFLMHEELGTRPGLYYLWERKGDGSGGDAGGGVAAPRDLPEGPEGVVPALQQSWDWRAAANFMCGGAGSGLVVASACAALWGLGLPLLLPLALVLVALGLLCVWLEIGRPMRFLNVFLHPQSSWMTREAIAATALFALALLAWLAEPSGGWSWLLAPSALLALAFLYCQAWILRAAKGIPIWREPSIVMLIVATGLAEGFGLLGVAAGLVGMSAAVALPLSALMLLAVAVRFAAWRSFREALGRKGAPTRALAALDELQGPFEVGAHLLPACLLVAGHLVPVLAATTLAFAGLLVVAGGWMLKHRIVTRAAFNQGFAVTRMPARGAGTGAPGVRPGWTAATTSAAG